MSKIGRNERCPCGSGKKFKRCCIGLPLQPMEERELEDYFSAARVEPTDPCRVSYEDRMSEIVNILLELRDRRCLEVDGEHQKLEWKEEQIAQYVAFAATARALRASFIDCDCALEWGLTQEDLDANYRIDVEAILKTSLDWEVRDRAVEIAGFF